MKSILIIYNEIPSLSTGGNIRVFYLLKKLSKYYSVTLITLKNKRNNFDLKELKKICNIIIAPCFIEEFFKKPRFTSYFIKALCLKFERLFSPFKSRLLKNHNYQTFCLKKELKDILKKEDFDYIEIEHSYLGCVLDNINTNARKIIDFHNVHSYMKNNLRERKLINKYEKELNNKTDLVICCSKEDKKRLEGLGYKKILIVPNGVDNNYFKFNSNKGASSLLFVGDLTYNPNFKGLKYFFQKIYPLIPKDIKINIIGKLKPDKFKKEKKLKNVEFHNFVKEIRPYFSGAILICPLLDGGGTRLKILTAFSAGSPVVSTSKGAEGIKDTDNKNICIANTPELFAKKIRNILSNNKDYKRLRKNARKLVESKYDWAKIIKKYYKDLEKINKRIKKT